MRILVTGSRTWADTETIHGALVGFISRNLRLGQPLTIVHGACPSGADWIADEIAREHGWQVERWRAEWDRYGRRAGHVRNNAMVDAGADVCLAFILDASPGAMNCADLAERFGIPVVRYERTTQR